MISPAYFFFPLGISPGEIKLKPMTNDVLHVDEAEAQREVERILRDLERMHEQNKESGLRIERARARTRENLAAIRMQLDRMAA